MKDNNTPDVLDEEKLENVSGGANMAQVSDKSSVDHFRDVMRSSKALTEDDLSAVSGGAQNAGIGLKKNGKDRSSCDYFNTIRR